MIPPSLMASDGMWIVSGCSRGRFLVSLWIPGVLLILVVWIPHTPTTTTTTIGRWLNLSWSAVRWLLRNPGHSNRGIESLMKEVLFYCKSPGAESG